MKTNSKREARLGACASVSTKEVSNETEHNLKFLSIVDVATKKKKSIWSPFPNKRALVSQVKRAI